MRTAEAPFRTRPPRLNRRTAQRLRREAAALWAATANPDGPGLLVRGHEYHPVPRERFDLFLLDAALRLARLADEAAAELSNCPDTQVRRSAAVLAARSHPLLAAFDG